MDALNEISKNTERIADLVGYVDGVIEKKAEELTNLDDAIAKRTVALEKLDNEFDESKRLHEKELESLAEETSNAQKKLSDVQQELATATTERDKARKEHNDFVSYKMVAEKALKAKDDALVEREIKLDEAANEFKRRYSALSR